MSSITSAQIARWGAELSLSADAIAQIQYMNESEPARTVGGSRSVRGKFPSSIVQLTLQFESHKGELPFLWLAHYRWKCRLILDQPFSLRVEYQEPTGRKRSFDYPPDYFWIGISPADINSGQQADSDDTTRAEFIECKRFEKDLEWAIDTENNPDAQPWRYKKLANGLWCSPPAEAAAQKIGLCHRIFIAERCPPTLLNNLEFLADYFSAPNENNSEAVQNKIQAIVVERPGILVREIIAALEETEVDALYFMIARHALYIDIDHECISPNYTARVFPDFEQFEAQKLLDCAMVSAPTDDSAVPELIVAPGTELSEGCERMTIASVANNAVTLVRTNGREMMLVDELERRFLTGQIKTSGTNGALDSEKATCALSLWREIESPEWKVMLRRDGVIRPFLYGSSATSPRAMTKSRTHHRWISRYRCAESKYGKGFGILGLRPLPRSGNRKCKLDKRVERILNRVLDEHYETKTAPSVELVYGECCRQCETFKPPLNPPSRKTIYKRISERDLASLTRQREGPRSAYEFEGPYWDDKWDGLSIDGEHAWAVAHIDHTQMNIATPPTPDGLSLGRPWITVMLSPKHKRVLAVYISYEPPSYRSCMGVIRECVNRHHRLPRCIVIDGGKEFESVYFEQLLARYRIIKKVRLPAKPRFGAVLERTNCMIDSRLLHNLPGNTKLSKRVRVLTKEFNPEKLAIWPLRELQEIVTDFAYEWLDNLPDKLTGISPRESFAADMRLGGPRTHMIIPADRNFNILTLPTTKSGNAKVRRREGVIVNRIPYWRGSFRSNRFIGKKFPVRYDPYNLSIIYIQIDGEWEACESRRFKSVFRGLSEPEIRLATVELMAGATTLAEKRRRVTATSLATFFYSRNLSQKAQRVRARAQSNRASPKKHEGESVRRACPGRSGAADMANATVAAGSPSSPSNIVAFPKRKPDDVDVRFIRRPHV